MPRRKSKGERPKHYRCLRTQGAECPLTVGGVYRLDNAFEEGLAFHRCRRPHDTDGFELVEDPRIAVTFLKEGSLALVSTGSGVKFLDHECPLLGEIRTIGAMDDLGRVYFHHSRCTEWHDPRALLEVTVEENEGPVEPVQCIHCGEPRFNHYTLTLEGREYTDLCSKRTTKYRFTPPGLETEAGPEPTVVSELGTRMIFCDSGASALVTHDRSGNVVLTVSAPEGEARIELTLSHRETLSLVEYLVVAAKPGSSDKTVYTSPEAAAERIATDLLAKRAIDADGIAVDGTVSADVVKGPGCDFCGHTGEVLYQHPLKPKGVPIGSGPCPKCGPKAEG